MTMVCYLYILRCAGGSHYVGTTRGSLETRFAEHQAGKFDGYTSLRRPVERQVKDWRREKKEALIRGDYALLPELAKRGHRSSIAE